MGVGINKEHKSEKLLLLLELDFSGRPISAILAEADAAISPPETQRSFHLPTAAHEDATGPPDGPVVWRSPPGLTDYCSQQDHQTGSRTHIALPWSRPQFRPPASPLFFPSASLGDRIFTMSNNLSDRAQGALFGKLIIPPLCDSHPRLPADHPTDAATRATAHARPHCQHNPERTTDNY